MEKRVIVLIDDDDDDKLIFGEVVEDLNSGYQCVFASDGVEGLKVLRDLDVIPKFIFIDLNMPKMDGKQCLSEIKQIEKFADVPIIIYTTSKLDSDETETKKLGADYFLTKPGLFSDLQIAIRNVLNGNYEQNELNAVS